MIPGIISNLARRAGSAGLGCSGGVFVANSQLRSESSEEVRVLL